MLFEFEGEVPVIGQAAVTKSHCFADSLHRLVQWPGQFIDDFAGSEFFEFPHGCDAKKIKDFAGLIVLLKQKIESGIQRDPGPSQRFRLAGPFYRIGFSGGLFFSRSSSKRASSRVFSCGGRPT